jgi:hypothetical protein
VTSRPHSVTRITRDGDGSARLRLRFSSDEVDLIEGAAGGAAVLPWIYDAILDAAEEATRSRPAGGDADE